MITIPQPAMVLNAENAPGPHYKMTNSMEVPAGDTPDHYLGWAAIVAKGFTGGKMKALVLNCHGRPAHLGLGLGIGWTEVPLFEKHLKGLVDDLWIVACSVVSFSGSSCTGT
jgi:hypothetical protein